MSTTFKTQSRANDYVQIVLNETGTSIQDNTSTVSVKITYKSSNQYYLGVDYFTLTDSTGAQVFKYTRSYGVVSGISSGSVDLKSQTITVGHNNDGTGSLTLAIKYRIGNSTWYTTLNAYSFALSNIPRASSMTVENSVQESGQVMSETLIITSSSTSGIKVTVVPQITTQLYHVLAYTFRDNLNSGSQAGGSVNVNTNGSSANTTISRATILGKMQTAYYDVITFTLTTYSDSAHTAQIGSPVTYTWSVLLDNSMRPTISLTDLAIYQTKLSGYALFDGYTKVSTTYSSAYKTGATGITIYFSSTRENDLDTPTVTYNSTTTLSTSGTVIGGPMTSNASDETYTISAYAVDSRGMSSTTVSKSIQVYKYTKPVVTITAYRVDASSGDDRYTPVGGGEIVYYKLTGSVQQFGSPNVNTIKTDTAYTYIQAGSDAKVAYDTDAWKEQVGIDSTLTITAQISDQVSSNTATYTVGMAVYPVDLYDDGIGNVGVGLGTIAEPGKTISANPYYGPNVTEYIEGLQPGATGNWIGMTKQKAVYNGMLIAYWLPYTGNGNASLALVIQNQLSKNLYDVDQGTTGYGGGVTPTVSNGVIDLKATSTTGAQYLRHFVYNVDPTKTYMVSCKAKKVALKGSNPKLLINIYGSNDMGKTWSSSAVRQLIKTSPTEGTTYDLSGTVTGYSGYRLYIYNYGDNPVTLNEETQYWNIQFEEGTTATTYTAYTGKTEYYPIYRYGTTRLTTHYSATSVIKMMFRNGAWYADADYGDTVTYNLRNNYSMYSVYSQLYRYKLLFSKGNNDLLPCCSTNITAPDDQTSTTRTITTESFNPFGQIFYYSSSSNISANGFINSSIFTQYLVDLRYSFIMDKTLTKGLPVYVVCVPQGDGTVKFDSTPISQTLPSSVDGKVYIFLGLTYDTYRIELQPVHPIYYFDGVNVKTWYGNSTTVSSVITRSSGATVSYAHAYRSGNMVTVYCAMTYTTEVASASNIFTGTLETTYCRPPYDAETIAYYGGHAIGIRIQPSGAVTVRNASSSGVKISDGIYWSLTYVV